MIDANLVKFLQDGATAAGSRVHTSNPPQGSPRPYIVILRTGGAPQRNLRGQALFSRASFTIIAVADEPRYALPLAKEVKDRLDNHHGDMVGPDDTTSVKSCRCVNAPTDVTVVDGDKKLAGYAQDFAFVFVDP